MIDEVNTAKQIGDNPFIRDYTLLAVLLGVGIIAFFKIFNDDENKHLKFGERIGKTIYGVGGSILTTWVVFEALFAYTNLPLRLDLAIAAAFGYIGAETAIKVGMRLIGKKFNIELTDLEPKKENKTTGENNNG